MRPILSDVLWSGASVKHTGKPYTTAELTKVVWVLGHIALGPTNHVLDGEAELPTGRGKFPAFNPVKSFLLSMQQKGLFKHQ